MIKFQTDDEKKDLLCINNSNTGMYTFTYNDIIDKIISRKNVIIVEIPIFYFFMKKTLKVDFFEFKKHPYANINSLYDVINYDFNRIYFIYQLNTSFVRMTYLSINEIKNMINNLYDASDVLINIFITKYEKLIISTKRYNKIKFITYES